MTRDIYVCDRHITVKKWNTSLALAYAKFKYALLLAWLKSFSSLYILANSQSLLTNTIVKNCQTFSKRPIPIKQLSERNGIIKPQRVNMKNQTIIAPSMSLISPFFKVLLRVEKIQNQTKTQLTGLQKLRKKMDRFNFVMNCCVWTSVRTNKTYNKYLIFRAKEEEEEIELPRYWEGKGGILVNASFQHFNFIISSRFWGIQKYLWGTSIFRIFENILWDVYREEKWRVDEFWETEKV